MNTGTTHKKGYDYNVVYEAIFEEIYQRLEQIDPYNECRVETLTNGKTQVTAYGKTTGCETYILEERK